MAMQRDSWEGEFNWQGYALQGRPDVLNYIRRGDVSWEGLWNFYRQQAAPAEAILAITNLFHAFQSAEYDRQGSWLDVDGPSYRRLRHWAEFAVEQEETLSEHKIQAGLAYLAEIDLVSAHYYHAAFQVYMEVVLDRHAARWRRHSAGRGGIRPGEFPDPAERRLPIYYPEASRFPELQDDPQWEQAVQSLLADRYQSWNEAYSATLVDEELEQATRDTGGTG